METKIATALASGDAVEAAEALARESKELIALLAHSLGTEKSREVVLFALSDLHISAGRLTAQHAIAVLEATAKVEGIVGVTSRFAKARLILQLKRPS